MILIADSGSTKTDWALSSEDGKWKVVSTQGINPVHQSREHILRILQDELMPQLISEEIESVFFYGSGVRPELELMMEGILRVTFTQSTAVEAHSDLLGAARSLCGHNTGIASILGTGANSCLYDGERIVRNTPALGYILGDEGSGTAIGKRFLHDMYKGILSDIIVDDFEKSVGLTLPEIINKVYRQPMPNRFLASLSKYVHRHLAEWQELRSMIIDCFIDFFRYNIAPYQRPDLPVSFVGSIAYYYQAELREAARKQGCTLGTILHSPIEGLVRFHTCGL